MDDLGIGIGSSIVLVSCLAGLMVALPALLVFFNVVFVRVAENAAYRLERGLILPFAIGIVTALIIGLPAAILSSLGSLPQLIGVIMFLFLFAAAFLGVAALARMVGMRISRLNGRESSPFMEAVLGALVLCFAFAFPLVGWFVLVPLALLMGLGVVTLAAVRPNQTRTEDNPAVAPLADEAALS